MNICYCSETIYALFPKTYTFSIGEKHLKFPKNNVRDFLREKNSNFLRTTAAHFTEQNVRFSYNVVRQIFLLDCVKLEAYVVLVESGDDSITFV
jgi:hypothetical protein